MTSKVQINNRLPCGLPSGAEVVTSTGLPLISNWNDDPQAECS